MIARTTDHASIRGDGRHLAFALAVGLSLTAARAAEAPPGDLCTGGSNAGTGLRGAYYDADPRGAAPLLVRVDPKIEAAGLKNLPARIAAKNPRWVRWCGWIRPAVSGRYDFPKLPAEVVVTVDRKRPPLELEAGKSYAILVEWAVGAGAADFSLQWTPPFGVTYAVPPAVLFPPVETVKPGC